MIKSAQRYLNIIVSNLLFSRLIQGNVRKVSLFFFIYQVNVFSMSKPVNYRLQPPLNVLLVPFWLFPARQREGQCLERQWGSGDMIVFVLLKTI